MPKEQKRKDLSTMTPIELRHRATQYQIDLGNKKIKELHRKAVDRRKKMKKHRARRGK